MMRHLAVLLPLLLVPMAGAGAGVCRDVGAGQEAGQMEDKSMEEASGLAMTRRSEGGGVLWIYLQNLHNIYTISTLSTHYLQVLFTINDHGGPATVIALLQSGDKLADLRLAGAENTDWEDIATTVIQGQVSCHWWTATVLASDWSRR